VEATGNKRARQSPKTSNDGGWGIYRSKPKKSALNQLVPHIKFRPMSIEQLKSEASALSHDERRELIAHLITVGRQRNAEYWDRLATKIGDQDPAHWVREESLDQALGLDRPKR
jgi:hypothetical protein